MKHLIDELKKILFYAGLSQIEYKKIKDEITKNNMQNLKIFTAVASAFLLIMFVLSFFVPAVRNNRLIYIVPLMITIIIFAASRYSLKDIHILTCIYIFMGVLYGFGCILGTAADPGEQTVTFVALLLTVPLLFTDRPIRMICSIYLFVIIFIVSAVYFKEKTVLIIDIINVCVFGTISAIVSSYMMKVKCQRYLYENEAAVLSETDLLTQLNNRNSFEKRITAYPSLCKKSLCCIYADANGLHELNNKKGHEAGDEMLRFIAANLKRHFGEKDVYRIGGDEFVAFALDSDGESPEKKLCEIKRSAEKNGYNVSVGYDIQVCGELNMDTLIKNAEKKMYEEKKHYYDTLGKTVTMRF